MASVKFEETETQSAQGAKSPAANGSQPTNLEALGLLETDPLALVSQDWAEALRPVEAELKELGRFLRSEFEAARAAGGGPGFLPAPKHVLRAFQQPLSQVKVLIVGQDPYPTFGHPIGLSFAVERHVRPIPRSLINIYKELQEDLGVPQAEHGDLSSWAQQGVLLLNRALSVRPGSPASHRGKGWERVTETAIQALVARYDGNGKHLPLVALLWGNDARNLTPMLGGAPTVTSPHPSPLSASRGFFGSKPFSRVNDLLLRQGAEPVDWTIT
ncbi:uracil-DNA glycosylase [Acaricomes phytoseiuli]|uniref:uracil-DNA glycosylase n=1 Tax=Acaricomes phytoseiuli TaxID=291968 RepID=UPI00036A9F90|nr:uracil-DNA glycosylase [Acaricomes phytoseiuli]MCW1250219.1 uracil-DNA glycosylase [Acaricomes phytoseiuli]